MNPYFAARLVDDRRASDRRALEASWGARRPAGRHEPLPTGGRRRVRRLAGWLLIDVGLRLAVGRQPAAFPG